MAGFNVNGDRQTVTVGGEQVEASKAYFDHQSQSWKYWFQLTAAEYTALGDTDKNNPDYTFIIEENPKDYNALIFTDDNGEEVTSEDVRLHEVSPRVYELVFENYENGSKRNVIFLGRNEFGLREFPRSLQNEEFVINATQIVLHPDARRVGAVDFPGSICIPVLVNGFGLSEGLWQQYDFAFRTSKHIAIPTLNEHETEETKQDKRCLRFIYRNYKGNDWLTLNNSYMSFIEALWENDYVVADFEKGTIKDSNGNIGEEGKFLSVEEKQKVTGANGEEKTEYGLAWKSAFYSTGNYPASETATGKENQLEVKSDGTEIAIYCKEQQKWLFVTPNNTVEV